MGACQELFIMSLQNAVTDRADKEEIDEEQ